MVEALRTRATTLHYTPDEAGGRDRRELVRFYAPVVYRFARGQGLADADAADLMREVFRGAAGDPGQVFAAARRSVSRLLNAPADRDATAGPAWDAEIRCQFTARAMGLVKHEFPAPMWQSFWKTAVDGRAAEEVGAELGMAPGAVHVAKCRVLARLREEVRTLRADAETW